MSDYIQMIAEFEEDGEFRPQAYKDGTQYSIGFGTRTTDPNEMEGTGLINEEEAYRRLEEWTSKDRVFIQEVGKREGLEWSDNELDALTSFTYNLGKDGLTQLVSGRDKATIADKMNEYVNFQGKPLNGLVRRRKAESELFSTPVTQAVEVPEPSQPVDRSYLDYTEAGVPASILRADGSVSEGEDPSISELWGASTYRNWVWNSLDRASEEVANPEPNFLLSQEQLEELSGKTESGYSKYNESELAFLSQSVSPENLSHRIDRIEADKAAKQTLEQAGMEGVGMEMLAGVTDPLLLPTMFLGGVGVAGKFKTAKAVATSMLSGASQNVAAEYLLKQGDTQRTDEDLMIAAAGGAIFSGSITAGAIGIKTGLNTRIVRANQIEAENKQALTEASVGLEYKKADSALATEVPNPVQRKSFMTEKEIIAKLQEEVGTRQDTISSKNIKKAKSGFNEYRKRQLAKIEKLKETPFKKPSSRNKQIKQLQVSIEEAQAARDNLIAENNAKLSTNSKLDQLQNGKIPDDLLDRYKEMKMESGEFDADQPTRDTVSLPVRKEQVEDPEEGVEVKDDVQSMGAMKVSSEFKDIATYDNLLPDTEVEEISNQVYDAATLGFNTPRVSRMASKAAGFRSTSTIVDTAPDNATRGLGIQTLKNGTRTIEGHQSIEEVADTLFHRNVPDYSVYEDAFDQYAKSKKVGILSKDRVRLKEEFDKEIVLAQARGEVEPNRASSEDSPVIKAAKARSRIYERSLKLNKDGRTIGFESVEHSNSYHSVVFDSSKILTAKSGSGEDAIAHADRVINTIAKAYQNGKIKLSRENAVRLAETQVARSFAYKHGTFNKVMSDNEYKLLDKELEANGVDITVREELKQNLFNKEDLDNMSPRAMFSLSPDLTASTGGVRMVDLIDTSMNRVMKYASDAAAHRGLSLQGYRSRHQWMRAVEEARKQSMNELRKELDNPNKKVAENAARELAKVERGDYADLLIDSMSLIFKEPLQSGSDAVEDLSKILRKQTSITRLRSTGLMSIPEYAIAMARNGGLSVISQLPSARRFDLRTTSIQKDEFMKAFSDSISATGHQEYLFGAQFYNNSDFDDATKTRLGNILNKVQGKMMNVTMTVNAFRTFQHGGEEMVARSIIKNLKDLSTSGKMTSNIKSSLVKVGGLSEDQVNQMITHFNNNPELDIFDSIRSMEPELNIAVSTAVRNTIGSSFMRMGVGETVPYANREMGKVLTSLLNFTIGSWEKMVVRGVKSDGLGLMASMFAGQVALAVMSQYAYVYSRAAGKEGEDRRKFIEKSLEDEGMFWGVTNRVGFLAAPMLPMQMLASARLLPEEITASPTKAGVNSMGIPSVDMGADYLKAIGSSGDLISSQFTDEYMGNKDREKAYNNIKRVLPWVDSPVYNAATGILD
ncbi:hypothetical protein [Marinomonas phage CPP1m]|uniref:Lysozyme n=2 Tax=Murciavirus CPP1m TaxID=2733327 RepID=A0A1W5S489_9CAUD|nr:endolysin [Marinomonas phage CPP1m]ARB11258.1 hypothetical protein [Marinomonas phage CPP1m]ARB11308.1 hypothetical protein [Marinomonas phage CPG1g]